MRTFARDALSIDLTLQRPDLESRFVEFVSTRRDRARRMAWRLLGGDDAAADDVCQEAFLKAYRGLDSFREDSSLDTWFYRILVRQAHSYRRWRTLRQLWSAPDTADAADLPDPSSEIADDPALRRRIAGAVESLSPAQRDAFVLVHLEGFAVREAAGILGKAEGTVKSHLHRALQSLRRDLADVDPSTANMQD